MKAAALLHLRLVVHILVGVPAIRLRDEVTLTCEFTYTMLNVAFVMEGEYARDARSLI